MAKWIVPFTLLLACFPSVTPCSDILVTPGASEDGSAIIAYNADDVRLFGYLYHYPSSEGKEGEMIQIYEWDSGVSVSRLQIYCRNAWMYLTSYFAFP